MGGRNRIYRNFSTRKLYTPYIAKKISGGRAPPRGPYEASPLVQRAPRTRNCIKSDFLKWASLGSHGFSSFASGFSPLKHKPLESLIDVKRAKLQIPEDLASIWDDVSSRELLRDFF